MQQQNLTSHMAASLLLPQPQSSRNNVHLGINHFLQTMIPERLSFPRELHSSGTTDANIAAQTMKYKGMVDGDIGKMQSKQHGRTAVFWLSIANTHLPTAESSATVKQTITPSSLASSKRL